MELGGTAEPACACACVCVFVFVFVFSHTPDTPYTVRLSPANVQVGRWEASVKENFRRPFCETEDSFAQQWFADQGAGLQDEPQGRWGRVFKGRKTARS